MICYLVIIIGSYVACGVCESIPNNYFKSVETAPQFLGSRNLKDNFPIEDLVDRGTLGAAGDFDVPPGCSTSKNKTGLSFCFYGNLQKNGDNSRIDARLNLTDIIDPNNSTMIGFTATYTGKNYVSLRGHFGGCAKVVQYGKPSVVAVGLAICTAEEPLPPLKVTEGFLSVLYNAKLFIDFSAYSRQLIHGGFTAPYSYVFSEDGPEAGSHMRYNYKTSLVHVFTAKAIAYLTFSNLDDSFKKWKLLGAIDVSGSVLGKLIANTTIPFINRTIILE
ncbi:hypothetical protein FOL47_005113 [Perkinsus chesapeaki]|uniref:Uncharacterized protein n=1 Tax=Perkinsus chesapeaki TaxID=330153 RepID=A0A7J6LYT5_PERCH|nr:hypothetical protein FOL47_005113 [Perkinsus chesapeaki]